MALACLATLAGILRIHGELIHPHLYLDKASTQRFMHRWKYPPYGNRPGTLREVQSYIDTFFLLHNDTASGALVSGRENCFLCDTRQGARTTVVGVLWRDTEPERRAYALAAMRQWHRVTFPDLAVLASAGMRREDHDAWRASTLLL